MLYHVHGHVQRKGHDSDDHHDDNEDCVECECEDHIISMYLCI